MKVTVNIGPLSKEAEVEMNRLKKGEVSGFVRDAIEFYVKYKNTSFGNGINVKIDYTIERLECIEKMLQQMNLSNYDNIRINTQMDTSTYKDKEELERQRKLMEAEEQLSASLSSFI